MNSTPLKEKRQKLLNLMRYAETTRRPEAAAISRREADALVPLSFSQERLWFLNQLAVGSQFYVESSAIRLHMEVRADALERAINAVVSRHEVLRARFELLGGQPIQSAVSPLRVPLATIDLSELPLSDRQREVERIALEHATRSFDLSEPPLLRTSLLTLGPADYVFLLAIHHIVSDGWSMSIFSREVSDCYRAFSTGRTVELPPLPIQYFDFAAWQRNTGGTGEWLETQLAYWREHLRSLPPLDLRLDLPRPEVLSYAGSHVDVRLPAHLSAGLRAIARREQATMFMTSLAVFAVVLNVHTGQTDLAVGTPTAGRNRAELEGLIGIFLNTLVLRLDLSGDPTFRELLRRVKQEALAAFDRQDVPFEQLVNELHPDRDLSRNPLFQVLFQFFTPPNERTGIAAAQPETIAVDRGTSILDLAWHLWDTADGVRGRIEYSTELFQRQTVERHFQNFMRVLSEVISHPDRPISELNALTPDEQNTLLTRWQGLTRAAPRRALHEVFAGRVAASPEAVALIEGDCRVSYLDLQHRVNRFANRLDAAGCRYGDRVAICLDRSVDMVAAALATLQIGAAYVPLDPSYPLARLEHIFRDSGARALVSDRANGARLQVDHSSIICVDAARSMTSGPDTESRIRTGPLDAAYVIYTSGSTGRPKGVVGLHGSTLNRFEWMWNEFPFEPGETACQRTPISFVDSVWETFGPLLAGVPLVIVPDAATRDTRELVDLLAEHRVSRLLVVPSLLQAILESGIDIRSALHRLRLWFASGERLPVETARRFRTMLPDARLVNLYGSSEVAGDILCEPLDGQRADDLVPIGRPIANGRAYIVDRMLRLVPPGVAGELCVAGANLARGYLHQPGLTAERFLPDPFSAEPGSRMYATGDRARHLPDGRIEFLGRNDHQIKIRGFRIEPEEVEAAIREHPAVRDVAVTAQDDAAGGRLTAWVVGHREPVAAEDLWQVAARTLPGHMIPRAVVWLESLPLTPNGKLDRAALLKMERIPAAADYVEPRSEAEQAIATLWAEVLGVSRIGGHDNFFDLGGHSLLAVRLVSRLRHDFGIELPLRDVFLHPTVSAFAAVIEAKLIAELEGLSEDDARRQLHALGNEPC